jgi:hypothetical protein
VESSFERACEFIPERWTSKSEMIRDKRAWAPFSQGEGFNYLEITEQPSDRNFQTGRWGCVGKGLAMKNLSYVTALLVSRYDIEFGPGEDGTSVWKDMKDDFTAVPGRLNLIFKLRKAG